MPDADNFSHLEALKKVKEGRKITGKQLHQVTGLAESNISDFFRGKSNISIATLDRMVDGMEQISPGAREEYARKLVGTIESERDGTSDIRWQIENLSKERKKQLILTIVESIARDPEPAIVQLTK